MSKTNTYNESRAINKTPTITNNRYLVKGFLNKTLEKVMRGLSAKRVLDVGCGEKPYNKYFQAADYYIGIDERAFFADIRSVGEHLPFYDKTFDIAICTQVLEHVENPIKVLKELNRVLIDRGLLILSTHGFWIEGHERTDYWRWTLDGLRKIFSETGFMVVETYSMRSYMSFFQVTSLFVPTSFIGKPLQIFLNFCGLFLGGNKGPNLSIVHIIKASKNSSKT